LFALKDVSFPVFLNNNQLLETKFLDELIYSVYIIKDEL